MHTYAHTLVYGVSRSMSGYVFAFAKVNGERLRLRKYRLSHTNHKVAWKPTQKT